MESIKELISIRNTGRVAGVLYIFVDIFGPLSLSYIPADAPQTVAVWLSTGSVVEQLVGRIEVLGGLWILLVTWGALRAEELPLVLNYLGLAVGAAGLITVVPPLAVLGSVFSVGEIVWGVWVGIAMFRDRPNSAARKVGQFFVARFFAMIGRANVEQ